MHRGSHQASLAPVLAAGVFRPIPLNIMVDDFIGRMAERVQTRPDERHLAIHVDYMSVFVFGMTEKTHHLVDGMIEHLEPLVSYVLANDLVDFEQELEQTSEGGISNVSRMKLTSEFVLCCNIGHIYQLAFRLADYL